MLGFLPLASAALASVVAASDIVEYTSSGAITFPSITASGTAYIDRHSYGALALPAITGAGTAGVEIAESNSIVLPSLTVSGTVERELKSSGSLTLAAFTATGHDQSSRRWVTFGPSLNKVVLNNDGENSVTLSDSTNSMV